MKLLFACSLLLPVAAFGCGGFFYPAPPTLDHYPERLPVKTMRELLRETSPPAAPAATFAELDRETRDLVSGFTAAPREVVLAKIAATLERNRTGDYRKRFANCLNDLHDLLIDGAAAEAAAGNYLEIRLRWMDLDDGFIHRPREKAAPGADPAQEVKIPPAPIQECLDGAAKATAALRPHWQVLLGAAYFRQAQFADAARVFSTVLTDAPEHPRAEIACLMLARCRLEQWREAGEREPRPENLPDLAKIADAAFADYLAKYPAGRFALDVPGWRVDLAREANDLQRAVTLLLEQMDVTGHPEIVRRAARELEVLLDETDLQETADRAALDALPIDELAKRPLAALALVYHLLDSRSREFFSIYLTEDEVIEQALVPMLRLRSSARKFLPKLATALAKEPAKNARAWRPKYLAVLAWAASEAGDHRQAVRICDLAGPALAGSDDLLFVRAVALQRAGDFPAARDAFEELRRDFPQSRLSNEFDFRLVTVLRDLHEAGLAAAELMRITDLAEKAHLASSETDDPAAARGSNPPSPLPQLHFDAELEQWRDTLLQFAPLPELERGLALVQENREQRARFRSVLCARHLAAEHFVQARQYAPEAAEAPQPEPGKDPTHVPFTGADWSAAILRLERLTSQAAFAPAGTAAADAEFALASAWAGLRGRLTLGSIDERLPNAIAAGYGAEAAAREIESRDELQHALPHYLAAAHQANAGAVAAKALQRANEALRLIAERSPRAAARAFETDAGAVSRRCYERLKAASSAKARQHDENVWWTFRPPAEAPWTPGFESKIDYEEEVAVMFAFIAPAVPGSDGSEPIADAWSDNRPSQEQLVALCADVAEKDPVTLIRELQAIRADCARHLRNPSGAAVLNDIDDLTTFLHEPGLTAPVIARYFGFRLGKVPLDTDYPELDPWADYVAYIRLVHEPEYRKAARILPFDRPMAERLREFLQKYPLSHKREAAMVRLACLLARQAHGHVGVADCDGDPPELARGETLALGRGEPGATPAALDALAACEREFPAGRYAANLRFWHAALAIDSRDWPTALHELTALLDDPRQGDLHLDAALNLGYTFLQLLDDPSARRPLLNALRAEPAAQRRLWQFLESPTVGARLRILEGFLREQLSGA